MKPIALALLLAMAGCGRDGAADSDAAELERAADQTTPGAADILRNAAENPQSADGNAR